jgi:Trk K+ transport system NAD-binding subunit
MEFSLASEMTRDLTRLSQPGKKVRELQELAEGNLLVLAIQRGDGNVLRSGFLEESLREDDAVIIVGRTHALPPNLRAEVVREELL